MNYFGQLFLKKSTIGYGCLVLLGSVSIAGVLEVELKNQVISNWASRIAQNVRDSAQSNSVSQEGQQVTVSHVFGPFIIAGQAIKSAADTVWPYFKGAYAFFKSVKEHIKSWLGGLQAFFKSLIDPEVFHKIFENLHLKFWHLIIFIVSGMGGARSQFAKLFGEDKKSKTAKAVQFLLGLANETNKYFKAKPNVFSYLLLRWLDDPKKITGKFERLSKTIKRLTDSLKKDGEGSSSSDSDSEDVQEENVYWVEIPSVQDYLDVKKGFSEDIFNIIWTTEIMSKINTGKDYTGGAKTWALLGNIFA